MVLSLGMFPLVFSIGRGSFANTSPFKTKICSFGKYLRYLFVVNMVNSSGNGSVVTVEGAISVEDHLSECVPGFTSVKIRRQSG